MAKKHARFPGGNAQLGMSHVERSQMERVKRMFGVKADAEVLRLCLRAVDLMLEEAERDRAAPRGLRLDDVVQKDAQGAA